MKRHKMISAVVVLGASLFSVTALADINRVRVINDTKSTVYIHVGGYAPSYRLDPGQWKIYYYPFVAYPPEQKGKSVKTSLLVATSGGKWATNANGYTYLSNPQLVICLDYQSEKYRYKTGNRVWTVKSAHGFDQNCEVKKFKMLKNQ